ncbi:hypothetical protein NG831_21265 [Xanthomonas sacchari]|uniref:hypothetical protein n=1 Tax=Xanthomonas sacchari TaxID=56458 RepID=UPI00224CC168|nr:hypothetical protein [Xanthomonas sacchari]UYK66590.1 hypothetical protein NG831_21265 [Xanthomonas sacchari]
MKLQVHGTLLAFLALTFCQQAQGAVQAIAAGKIIYVENGWYGEGLALHTSNDGPSGCPGPLNNFAIDKNHPSYKELTAIALAAYTTNANVEFVVDSGSCPFGNSTKVLSIRLIK